jgi:L-cysteine:1D-myo-inositol 2-amino-2-deoxy-alpha-D-glucopyranoside ligase
MFLYNSLTANTELFTIPTNRPVKLYVCGVTPYDTTHMGHARTYLVFDVLVRYLRSQGAEVEYCQNVTDVDDPLFVRARRDGLHWYDLAQQHLELYLADCAALNMLQPTYFPRVTEEIATIIPVVEQLVTLGHAYVREGNVYFDISSDPDFGMMARMGYEEMLKTANERGNTPDDTRKRDPLDFVLWQASQPDEPSWDSPWGAGRPGWHIECSAMATRYLGSQLDIHGGGSDLVFPHHSCEIAQTEPVTGLRPFVRIWMHTGMVGLHGEKMSKSLGNLVFVREALKEHSADALRWYLLTESYRADFSYERDGVVEAEAQIARLREALEPAAHQRIHPIAAGSDESITPLDLSRGREQFLAALDNDLDTPRALTILAQMTTDVLGAAVEGRDIGAAQATLADVASVMGFSVQN